MRFLLYFPLPLLLILGSYVSIDDAPQSVFKPVSPWPPQKPRLKRSTDDPPAAAADALDSLSFDELEQRYAKDDQALKESNATVAAAKAAWQQKEAEAAGLREQYDLKKTEWEAMDASANKEQKERDKAEEELKAADEVYTQLKADYATASDALSDATTDLAKATEVLPKMQQAKTRLPEAQRELTAIDSSLTCNALQRAIDPARRVADRAKRDYDSKEQLVVGQQKNVDTCTTGCPAQQSLLTTMKTSRDQALAAFTTVNQTYTTAIADHAKCAALVKEIKELSEFADNNDQKISETTQKISDLGGEIVKLQAAYDDLTPKFDAAKTTFEEKEEAFTKADDAFTQNPKINERIAAESARVALTTLEETRNTATAEAEQLKQQYDGLSAKYTEDNTNFGTLKQVYEKRKKEKEQDPGTGSTPMIAIGSVIGLLVVAGAGVAVFIFLKRRKAKKEGAKPKDGQDPQNSGGAAPAVDSQNPATASHKPPSDPSAAPQPGSTKSNDAAPAVAAVAAPSNETPPAPAAPAVAAVAAAPAAPAVAAKKAHVPGPRGEDENGVPYLSTLEPGGVIFEVFIEGVTDKEIQAKLKAVAIPGTMVYRKDGNYVFNLENESGHIIVFADGEHVIPAQDARKFTFINAIDDDNPTTDRQKVLFAPNPKGCQIVNHNALNETTVFKIDKDRLTAQESYDGKEKTKDQMSRWAHILYATTVRNPDGTKYIPGKRAGAGQETADSTPDKETYIQKVEEYLSRLSDEEWNVFIMKEYRKHWEDCFGRSGCDICHIRSRAQLSYPVPSLLGHYRHEIGVWFKSVKNWLSSRLCWWLDDDDDTESCWSHDGGSETDEIFDIDQMVWDEDDAEHLRNLDASCIVEEADDSDADGVASTDISTSRSSAGGDDSGSEQKEKQKKRKRESNKKSDKKSDRSESSKHEKKKDGKQKKSDKKSDRSESSKHEKKKDGKQKKPDKKSDRSESSKHEKKKYGKQKKSDKKSDRSESSKHEKKKDRKQKKSDKKSDRSEPSKHEKKKDGKQKKKIQLGTYSTTSSTESDPRSPPLGWQHEQGNRKARCHGETFALWGHMKRPTLKRIYYDENDKKRSKISNENLDQLIARIGSRAKRGALRFDSELILNVLFSFNNVIKDEKPYIEFDEYRKSVRMGDIHGVMDTLHSSFNRFGGVGSEEWQATRWIMLGDYVDRGKQSLEVILYLMALRIRYPNTMVLLRGNHEIYSVNVCYGFFIECLNRIADRVGTPKGQEGKDIHFYFNYVFAHMPIICRHNYTLQCHGGITRIKVKNLPDMNKYMLKFMMEPAFVSPMAQDLLWNDPMHGIDDTFVYDEGRKAYCFGPKKVVELMDDHKQIQLLVRGHQMMHNGTEWFADKRMICTFGTSYYDAAMYNNRGSHVVVTADNDVYIEHFRGVPHKDGDTFKGDVMKTFVEKSIEQHNFYNMFPSLKAKHTRRLPEGDCPSETQRVIIRKPMKIRR